MHVRIHFDGFMFHVSILLVNWDCFKTRLFGINVSIAMLRYYRTYFVFVFYNFVSSLFIEFGIKLYYFLFLCFYVLRMPIHLVQIYEQWCIEIVVCIYLNLLEYSNFSIFMP